MNPPFALKREDEQEFTFVDHALDQMMDAGLLLCVLPISVMYASGRELAWRKQPLEKNSVLTVISFPNDLFYPQASVEPVIIVLKKGLPQEESEQTLFVRITDDGFIKLKKRRLHHGKPSQLAPEIKKFIFGKVVNETKGVLQAKKIALNDKNLEIIPQQYLDNAALIVNDLKLSLSSLQSELLFQEIRRGLV
jgi:type I restriction-modification system DNA methylase subunit